MQYEYIYIDDTFDQLELGTINGIEHGNLIKVNFFKPNKWENLIEDLIKLFPKNQGIILDLRLNDKPYGKDQNAKDQYAQYRGSTVAQELRTLAKEGVIKKDFPIILVSANDKLEESLDETSIDLFDAVISKNELGSQHGISYLDFKQLLIALSLGYLSLNEKDKKIELILNIEQLNILDTRFLNEFNKILINPVHVIVRFLKRTVLSKPSFLINEELLAARLGVSLKSEDWHNLKDNILSPFKYSGVFSDYYTRWWMPLIEEWWENSISKEENLRNLTAERRIFLLKKHLNLQNLIPCLKSEKSTSDSFWVVCKATKIPIDTIDGFLITNQDTLYPWQEKEYICIEEALRPTKIDCWKDVATIEKNRLQKLKDLYGRSEQRIRN